MNVTDLNRALNQVDDAYLLELEKPEKEKLTMKNRKRILRSLAVAAMIALLSLTAYATDFLHIRSLESGKISKTYTSYSQLGTAIAQTSPDLKVPQTLGGSFSFQKAQVEEVVGRDENGKKALTYQELHVSYQDTSGTEVTLTAYRNQKGVSLSNRAADQVRNVNDVTLEYRLDHYLFVPADYTLTQEENQWAQQPGNYVSYGSDTKVTQDVAFLSWENAGSSCFLMNSGANLDANTLFTLAEGLL